MAAATWIAAHARSSHRRGALLVGGDSAGGNLAAVVAIAARGNGPAISGQLRSTRQPFCDDPPSHSEPETTSCSRIPSSAGFASYLNDAADVHDWRASRTCRHAVRLPPAYVLTAGADPLRDRRRICRTTERSRRPVTHRLSGQFHGFFTMGCCSSNVAMGEIGVWLKALHEPGRDD
jgi:acetyl esterase